ncbi:hypothetical protein E3Q08_01847 [Wallemia mellicola]|uniref:Uncharacterized protein n=1 Tax=Wallemia mellicola TaxID=1708541 RepID=A0AB38MWZ7_9BASI|nr:hypothetical protein E3Q24_01472 [Wallemia mellicola]TIB86873.1 hypothetical protein E3Q21_01513 [Wallemia mellicola]TIB89815.1 hypothetical protein E3Q20_01510 [Wallemia mellicola]TIC06194.1 hypothetical protein E3Q16_01373 [Wallemia mellicola]TIC24394.1 hypothetical protein E3Q12_01503 [Wallemia mellicola]
MLKSFIFSILLLSTTLFATPLVDIVKNQVQVSNKKGHPEDALIHLIRTDDVFSDNLQSELFQRQSHLMFKIHYDELNNEIYVNGGKIDLNDKSLIDSNEPLKAGPVIKLDTLRLTPEELKQSDQLKKEHLEKLPKGIVAAQLRLKSVKVNDETTRLVVFIKVLEDNGKNQHNANPVFTLQVTQRPDVVAQKAKEHQIEEEKIEKFQADREAFIARLRESIRKMHHKVYKIVGMKKPHHGIQRPMVHLLKNEKGELLKVPCMHHNKVDRPHHPHHKVDHPRPHHKIDHSRPHHKPNCLHNQIHKVFTPLKHKLESLSTLLKLIIGLSFSAFFLSLFCITRAIKRSREQRRLYESLPTYDQVEIVTDEQPQMQEKA